MKKNEITGASAALSEIEDLEKKIAELNDAIAKELTTSEINISGMSTKKEDTTSMGRSVNIKIRVEQNKGINILSIDFLKTVSALYADRIKDLEAQIEAL